MWQSGSSAAVIGERVSRTRNAVCGKIMRLRKLGIELNKRSSDHAKRCLYKIGTWSDTQTQTLIDMWCARATSAEISAVVGRTAAAVERRVYFLREQGVDLPRNGHLGRRRGGYRPLGAPRKARTAPVHIPEVLRLVDVDKARCGASGAVLAIKSGQCRYPFGHPASPEFHFCTAPVRENQSFCPYHYSICYHKPPPLSVEKLQRSRFLSSYLARVGDAEARAS